MSRSLDDSQARLEAHFSALAAGRAEGTPVFALEHDLERPAFEVLAGQLRGCLAEGPPNDAHWLLWVIYAAELGYEFDGEEYWQTFEEETPLWSLHGDRYLVRKWFKRFRQRFSGAEPSGAWAAHFSIIAWPITHAVLPRDLQFQFARTLHYARHTLAAASSTDAATLGKLITREAWYASSRFRQFAQQEVLVGRLVLAILGAEEAEGDRILRSQTLHRIVNDLEHTRQAREWLAGARHAVTRFRGASRGGASAGGRTSGAQRQIPVAVRPPSIRPTLELRRAATGRWEVSVELPSFADIARLSDGVRSFLGRTRSTIAGAGGTWTPGSWLLGSGRKRVLLAWPGDREPLVRFERPNPRLEELLKAEGTLTKGPVWPCRVREDGTATEVLGRQIRTGQSYVLLYAGELAGGPSDMLSPCEISCEGIRAVHLNVPAAVTAQEASQLEQLGLQLCRTIRLWPAGLPPRRWDGEGSGEWLTTDSPCLGLLHDHAVDAYDLSLDQTPEQRVNAGQPGQAIFVTLPNLPAGEHILRVRALSSKSGNVQQRQAEGVVAISVREPEQWHPGTTAHGGLAVALEPGTPGLDDLLNNRLRIEALGPEGRQVDVALRSVIPPGDTPLISRRMTLPVSVRDWTGFLSDAAEEELSISSRARLTLAAEELGMFNVDLEREAAPLRWAFKRGNSIRLRLIDEAGDDTRVSISAMGFDRPAFPEPLDIDMCRAGFDVTPPGSLFRVRGPVSDDCLIVSVAPQGEHIGFEALDVHPAFSVPGKTAPTASELLDAGRLWSTARVIGKIGAIRRAKVVSALQDRFYTPVCGVRWIQAETVFRAGDGGADMLARLGENVGPSQDARSFSAVLRRGRDGLTDASPDEQAAWFADIAGRYSITNSPDLAAFAFSLASDPFQARTDHADRFEMQLSALGSFGILTRGARLAALLLGHGAWRC